MLTSGDKLMVTSSVAGVLNEGDIVKVLDVNENGIISFAFGDDFVHMGLMNSNECEKHFEKIVEKETTTRASSIDFERIEKIMVNSEITVQTVFDNCTVVSCRLPNGFVIVESSACVNQEDYSEEIGFNICMDKIANRIWELEAYKLHDDINTENIEDEEMDCPYGCNDCDDCPCDEDCDEDCDEYCDEDLDCDGCDDYDCPHNTRS